MNLNPRFLVSIYFLILVLIHFPVTGIGADWTQIGADIDGKIAGEGSGTSVSLSADGTIVAIGAPWNPGIDSPGHVRIYKNQSDTWTQIGTDINGEAVNDASGHSVSLNADGTIVAIGAYLNDGNGDNSGHVRVYQNIAGNWTQIGADIDGETIGDRSGFSVSLNADGTIVASGSRHNDDSGTDSGHVRVYQNIAGNWTQIGADIDGEAAYDQSGYSVSLSADGTVVAIGACENDGNGDKAGHVRVYKNSAGTWTQIGSDIDGEAAGDLSGKIVSLSADGKRVAIGASSNDGNGDASGHVRVYQNIADIWTQIGADIDGEAAFDRSGWSVSLNDAGTIVAIAADGNDGNGDNSGHVRVYQNIAGTWNQIGTDIYGETADDRSGIVSLSADGKRVAIGVDSNDGNGVDAGHVRVFEYYQFPWPMFVPTFTNRYLK